MENFYIKAANFIPEINFIAESGELSISGESYHEYTQEFYQPVFEWLRNYLATPGRTITFNFKMYYYNTSSSRRFLEIFDMLEDYQNNHNGTMIINWYYKENDLDMLESGEEYAEDTGLKFNLIPYS